MTCSLVIPVHDRSVIVADSRILEDTRIVGLTKKITKIGAVTVCFAGSVALARKVFTEWRKLEPPADISCVEEWADVARDQKGFGDEDVSFLLVCESDVILLYADGGYIDRTGEVTAVGSAGLFVEGYISSHRKCKTVDAAVRLGKRALKEASKTYVCIGPPFNSVVV